MLMHVGVPAQTDKSYPGDNRLMAPNSSHRRRCLAPRCRLITSWDWSRPQGFGCSPIKVVRELGLERRETVRIISGVDVETCEDLPLVREDRGERTSGASVVATCRIAE